MLLELCSDYLEGYWIIVESLIGTKSTYRILKTINEIDISDGKRIVTYLTDKFVPTPSKYLDYSVLAMYEEALRAMREYTGQ